MRACMARHSAAGMFHVKGVPGSIILCRGCRVELRHIPNDTTTTAQQIIQMDKVIKKLPEERRCLFIDLVITSSAKPMIRLYGYILDEIREYCREDILVGGDLSFSPSTDAEDRRAIKIKFPDMCPVVPDSATRERLEKLHEWYKTYGTTNCEYGFDALLPLKSFFKSNEVYITCAIRFQTKPKFMDEVIPDKLAVVKHIMNQGAYCDAFLTAKNGKNIPCHKDFLAAHSTVLDAMIRNQAGTDTCVIGIQEMSEAGVRAIREYCYTFEITGCINSSGIAIEVFEAAHTYGINPLKRRLKNLLNSQPLEWFSMDAALQLFRLARRVECCKDMKTLAVQVLKTDGKKLSESTAYKQLFREDPDVAMELCSMSFSN